MNIQVTGRKMSVTPALREHVENKIGDAVKVFDIGSTNCDVVLKSQNYKGEAKNNVCEVTLRSRGFVVRVECKKEDMYAAIDEAARMTTRQLRKYKTKIIDRRNRGKGPYDNITAQNAALENQVLQDEKALDEIPEDEQLVRTKYINMAPMDEEHALVQTDLLGHDFFVYTDKDTHNVHVIYRRKNGGYGILKPEEENPEQ